MGLPTAFHLSPVDQLTTSAAKLSRGEHTVTAHGAAAAAPYRWMARARSAASVTPPTGCLLALQRRGNERPRVNFSGELAGSIHEQREWRDTLSPAIRET